MTREEAARFPYGSAGLNPVTLHTPTEEPPQAKDTTDEQLKALADFVNARRDQERRERWRHEAGLDSNWHGQIIHELEDTL